MGFKKLHLLGFFLALSFFSGLWACTNNQSGNDYFETEFSNPFPGPGENAGLNGNPPGPESNSLGDDDSNTGPETADGTIDSTFLLEKLEKQKSSFIYSESPNPEELYIWGAYP